MDGTRKKKKKKKKSKKQKRKKERVVEEEAEPMEKKDDAEPVQNFGGRRIAGAKVEILSACACQRLVVPPFLFSRLETEGKLMGKRKAGYSRLLFIPSCVRSQILSIYGEFDANQVFGVPAKPVT